MGRAAKADIEIVGVVRGSKYSKVDEKIPRVVYVPFAQHVNPTSVVVYARTTGDPKTVFSVLRREINSLDSSIPIANLRTMDDQLDESLSAQRLMASLSVFFGILATLLAAIGLYGVMAYTVTRRTREIGIRLALGANRFSLLTLVMGEVALLTAAGVAIAIPAALTLTRLIRSELYGIVPNDPMSIAIAATVLGLRSPPRRLHPRQQSDACRPAKGVALRVRRKWGQAILLAAGRLLGGLFGFVGAFTTPKKAG